MPDEPKKKGRGGSRKHPADCKCGNCPKLGRKKNQPEKPATGNKSWATETLARIGSPGWLEYRDIAKVKNDSDYALHIIACGGQAAHTQFESLKNRELGKAVQTVNHVHDKPIELNVNLSMAELVRKVRQRKQEYERSRG